MNKGLSPAEQMMNIFTDKDNTSAEKKYIRLCPLEQRIVKISPQMN